MHKFLLSTLALSLSRWRWGVVSFADSLDCVGILAKDIESVESVFGMPFSGRG